MSEGLSAPNAHDKQISWVIVTCRWVIGIYEGLEPVASGTDAVCTPRGRALRFAASMWRDLTADLPSDATDDEKRIAYADYFLQWAARQLGYPKTNSLHLPHAPSPLHPAHLYGTKPHDSIALRDELNELARQVFAFMEDAASFSGGESLLHLPIVVATSPNTDRYVMVVNANRRFAREAQDRAERH